MDLLERLEQWKERDALSAEQHAQLSSLVREEPFSLFAELNVLLYGGVLAFVAGLGWTVATWSEQMGDVLVSSGLCAILAACSWYCFTRSPAWSKREIRTEGLFFDYVLYLSCLVWCIELAYLEKRFHLLAGQWDFYLLATAVCFLFLAYRFDNRFVLSLAFSSLGGWFGLTVQHLTSSQTGSYRQSAFLYCLVVGAAGALLRRAGLKPHFFNTYLNIVANILFVALLSGVFEREDNAPWLLALLLACCMSLAWGLRRREFIFVVYCAVYGYIGLSSLLIRDSNAAAVLLYFVITATAMVVGLVLIARRFGRAE